LFIADGLTIAGCRLGSKGNSTGWEGVAQFGEALRINMALTMLEYAPHPFHLGCNAPPLLLSAGERRQLVIARCLALAVLGATALAKKVPSTSVRLSRRTR
jgi:hypothetical protein